MTKRLKTSDYIANLLSLSGIRHIFMITGGGAMHMNYSFGTHPDLCCIFNHHEQASAIAAESYYRANNQLAVVNVTSGPGGTNAITGVYGAWTDSIGMIVLSGQVKYETTIKSTGLTHLRQFGDQEADIISMVKSITKYSVMIEDPLTIRYHIEKALFLAKSGRPGPCWIDIPLDIQAALIDPDEQLAFDPMELELPWLDTENSEVCQEIYQKLISSSRPVILAGTGVRLSGQHSMFMELIEQLEIPVVTGWNAHDVIWNDHPCYIGRPGTVGDRPGNFAVQNADLLLILGCRLNIRQVSYNWKSFAREAYKIWVDIDELELRKPSVHPDMPVHADLASFIPSLLQTIQSFGWQPPSKHAAWLAWCKERQLRYPVVLPHYRLGIKINPYYFTEVLYEEIPKDSCVIAGNGTASVVGFQAANLFPDQRLWANSGCAAMGYDLPAAIGASIALAARPIICLAGDGSIMMNLQELQTIASNKLPIKIFVLNNGGYFSIYQTQHNFFSGQEVGAGPNSGVTLPSFEKISAAFNLPYYNCSAPDSLRLQIKNTLIQEGPCICEIFLDQNQAFSPKLSSKSLPDGTIISPALEDLSPFLDPMELQENMIIPLLDR